MNNPSIKARVILVDFGGRSQRCYSTEYVYERLRVLGEKYFKYSFQRLRTFALIDEDALYFTDVL